MPDYYAHPDGFVYDMAGSSTGLMWDDSFVSGLASDGVTFRRGTRPTQQNTGVPDGVTLTPYTGPNAGGVLIITAPATFTRMDFGNTKIVVRSPDVVFVQCRWRILTLDGQAHGIDFGSSLNTGGGRLIQCDVENACQIPSGVTGVRGWNVTVERCAVWGFVDNLSIVPAGSPGNAPVNVTVLDTWLGPLAFYWAPTTGIVHVSDTKVHADGVQWHGGSGARYINTHLDGHYSTEVGTGTPGSGSEHADHGYYTQAEGETVRHEIVMGDGTYANPSARGYGLGGSIAALMFTPTSSKGTVADVEIAYCWGSGGAAWLNVGSATTGHFGSVYGLRVQDDQRHARRALSLRAGLTVDAYDNEYVDEDWQTIGVPVVRANA